MDKYEYNLKLEEITKLADQGYYEDAADIIDTIDWRRVRNVRTLCMISEIYEEVGRLQDSKALLLRAYRKSQAVRNILFHLTEISVKLREFDDAAEFYAGLNNSSSGTSLSYGIDFTTYNSIKNGSYSKLMRKYYSNQASESTNGATANKNTGKVHSIDIQKNNATVNRDNAASLVDSASELKKYSLWSKVDKTDKDGNTAKEYDTDKIAKAVSSFVKDYNSLVSSTADSSSRYVLNSASNMVNYTRANADLLKKIGISVGSDNKLTVDEDKLKASDMAVVKSVFKDSGSFGQTISAKASTIYGNAVSQLSELSTKNSYTSNGLYSYSSGYTYNQYT